MDGGISVARSVHLQTSSGCAMTAERSYSHPPPAKQLTRRTSHLNGVVALAAVDVLHGGDGDVPVFVSLLNIGYYSQDRFNSGY